MYIKTCEEQHRHFPSSNHWLVLSQRAGGNIMWWFTALHAIVLCIILCRQKTKSLSRVRCNSRYAEPNKPLYNQLNQTWLWPSDKHCAPELCTVKLTSSLIYSCDAYDTAGRKCQVCICLSGFPAKRTNFLSLYIPHSLSARAVQQGRALWSRWLAVICSLSVPHSSSCALFLIAKRAFKVI